MNDYSGENRRSGQDRRINEIDSYTDRRISAEQRDLLRHQQVFFSKLKKNSIFRSLSDDQFLEILSIASKRTYAKGEVLYREGNEADDMYILLEGVLQVTVGGKEVNLITPIGFAGELETLSGEPRLATVTAKGDCVLMRLNKTELSVIFERNADLYKRFIKGVIIDVSVKMRTLNAALAKMKEMRRG